MPRLMNCGVGQVCLQYSSQPGLDQQDKYSKDQQDKHNKDQRDKHIMKDDLEDSMELGLDQIASLAGNASSRATS
ncbi:hypothetical protein TanjilG_07363 [Lupinus angustifolius]|uniref:Uncharacterized protein n=1 Tax=Lupinus angustifolius TaxID=3871 RepID=A0A4P1R049_LUPAN|nr:hypothetical protein TanjilG_07363 [Lupinus angustifolius]